jgi:hypothetical protein
MPSPHQVTDYMWTRGGLHDDSKYSETTATVFDMLFLLSSYSIICLLLMLTKLGILQIG